MVPFKIFLWVSVGLVLIILLSMIRIIMLFFNSPNKYFIVVAVVVGAVLLALAPSYLTSIDNDEMLSIYSKLAENELFGHFISENVEAPNKSKAYQKAIQYILNPAEFDGHAYGIFSIKKNKLKTYDESETFCEEMGGHLAVINSQKENDFIYQYVLDMQHRSAFFGYSDQRSEGNWEWVTGDSDYSNWGLDQPNNGRNNPDQRLEHYAQFFLKEGAEGTWNDAPFGSNTDFFLCEWE